VKRNPWLTDADLAEIGVVAHALVEMAFAHQEHCRLCREQGDAHCKTRGAAIDAVCSWVEHRALLSKAEALRRRHVLAALEVLTERSAA
jgi:hypothetical protein